MELLGSGLVSVIARAGSRRIIPELAVNNLAPFKERRHVKERRHAKFFDVINSSLAINTPDQFRAWAQGDLQHIFPHKMMICCLGTIEGLKVYIQHLITCNLPAEYLKTLQQEASLNSCPILAQWFKHKRPVLYEITDEIDNSTWLENFKRYSFNNMAAHGHSDLNSGTTSYFSFSHVPGKLTSHHANLLEMLVPHLHIALIRALQGVNKSPLAPKAVSPCLTAREREILHWLATGKSNWEIAQVLSISEYTVKNHVQRILIKLRVNTRAQAVAKGIVSR